MELRHITEDTLAVTTNPGKPLSLPTTHSQWRLSLAPEECQCMAPRQVEEWGSWNKDLDQPVASLCHSPKLPRAQQTTPKDAQASSHYRLSRPWQGTRVLCAPIPLANRFGGFMDPSQTERHTGSFSVRCGPPTDNSEYELGARGEATLLLAP